MVAYLFSYIDRSILSLLVGPIRQDLSLSDTQVSLLHGLAFAIFYTLLGFPIGRYADRSHRVRIITAGIVLWSLFTAACGLTRSFWQLFLMRVGVGVGEAALNPCAYSIITDSFPRRLLARAISVYVMGTYLGFGTAFIIGGVVVSAIGDNPTTILPIVGELRTWQAVFFYVGLPGLVVASLVYLTVREPQRQGLANPKNEGSAVPFSVLFEFLKINRFTIASHVFGFGFIAVLVNGLVLWTPTFFNRTYGWEVADAGILYGLVLLAIGPSGIFLGGWLADRIDAKEVRGGSFMVAASLTALGVAPAIASPLVNDPYVSLALIALLVLCTSAPWGVAVSALQQFTPNEMRGQVSAIYLFFVNIIGIGLGPTMIAMTTDYVFGNDAELRYSMAIVGGAAGILGAGTLALGLPQFRQSLSRAESWRG